MRNYFNNCVVDLFWPQQISDELENTLGEGASLFTGFDIEPDFALNLRFGDHISFLNMHNGGYPYIKRIQPRTVQNLDYLSYLGLWTFTVDKNRTFAGNVMYLGFDLDFSPDSDLIIGDDQRMDYFSAQDRFKFIDPKKLSDSEREKYLNTLLESIRKNEI